MKTVLNAKSWKELKKQLRPLQGKAVFTLKRINSMNDGEFIRVLHQVKAHELVFFDGRELTYLTVSEQTEKNITYFENGFTVENCTYMLNKVMEEIV